MTHMKNLYKFLFVSLVAVLAASCADFDEVNTNPKVVTALSTKPYYALNKAIIKNQQNPNDAERVFVICWSAAARQDGEDGYNTSLGRGFADYSSCLYGLTATCITSCNQTMDLVEKHLAGGCTEHEAQFYPNLTQFARIWRVYLMSEFVDSFGPMPNYGFLGENPVFNTVQENYYFMFDELADALPKIDLTVNAEGDEVSCDAVYGFDPVKWKKYGISLWMRLAMRLSEADPNKAKEQFEAAVKMGQGITTADETFAVQEYGGWDDMTGVMSRTWDIQCVSATFANLTTNFGGAKIEDVLADPTNVFYTSADPSRYTSSIKDAHSYLGVNFNKHWETNTDNPTIGYFFDGIPTRLDPRALEVYYFAGDYSNRLYGGYFPYAADKNYGKTFACMNDEDGNPIPGTDIETKYSWNGMQAGIWNDDKAAMNGIVNGANGELYNPAGYTGTYGSIQEKYRNTGASLPKRVYFGPWETYFLLAEAAVRGWNAGISAEDAYNKGIKADFDYLNLSHLYDAYINSEDYNRVGTSVKFSHTAEPVNYEIAYKDGYTGEDKTTTYKYPDANKILYAGHKLNDQLTKIITQKFIANMPYLPLENWSEHRRLGLPFWEMPSGTSLVSYMPDWTQTSYQTGQKWGHYPQRMVYPNSLKNADPKEYEHALELLGATDNTAMDPIWWAIGGH